MRPSIIDNCCYVDYRSSMNVNLGSRLAELRKQIAIGSEQADRGEFVDGEETFAEIRHGSAERKRAEG